MAATGARRVERVAHFLAEVLGGFLAPFGAFGRPAREAGEQRFQVADDFRIGRHQCVDARHRRQRQHRQRIGPRLGLQFYRVETYGDDQIGFQHQLALDQPADDAAGAQWVILWDHALAFGRGEHRRAEPLGEPHELGRRAAPVDAEARNQDRTFRLAEHVQRRLEIGAVGTGDDPIWHQRRLGGVVAGLARGLALRKFEMHRAGRSAGCGAHGAAHLLAYRLGVDGRAPLHDRLIDRQLVDALTQSRLVRRTRIGIGDRD